MLGFLKVLVKPIADAYTAKQELKVTAIKERTRLISQEGENNANWEIAALENSGKALKWGSFMMFTTPIILTVVGVWMGKAETVAEMWAAFHMVPEGWMQIYYAITGGIWGIAALKSGRGGLGSTIKEVVSVYAKAKGAKNG